MLPTYVFPTYPVLNFSGLLKPSSPRLLRLSILWVVEFPTSNFPSWKLDNSLTPDFSDRRASDSFDSQFFGLLSSRLLRLSTFQNAEFSTSSTLNFLSWRALNSFTFRLLRSPRVWLYPYQLIVLLMNFKEKNHYVVKVS